MGGKRRRSNLEEVQLPVGELGSLSNHCSHKKIKSARTVVDGVGCSSCIYNVGVEDPNHSSIQERMIGVIVLGQNHYITVRCRMVDGVLFPANVVRSIIDTENVVQVHSVIFKQHFVQIGCIRRFDGITNNCVLSTQIIIF